MATLTHIQAQQLLQAEADGLLGPAEARQLAEHLRGCPACRAYGADLRTLATALPRAWQARWGASTKPSPAVLPKVLTGLGAGARVAATGRGLVLGFNWLGVVSGIVAVLLVTGAAAAAIQGQQNGFNSANITDASATPTETETVEASATVTATECQDDQDQQDQLGQQAQQDQQGLQDQNGNETDNCLTGTPEVRGTECDDDCGPTQAVTPEATETREPTETEEASETPAATRTPRPTEVEPTEPPEATEVEPTERPEPTEVEPTHAPRPTHQPEPTEVEPTDPPESTEVEPTEPHETQEPTEQEDATHTPKPGHTPEPTESGDDGAQALVLPGWMF